MNISEFDQIWASRLEPGFSGLEIQRGDIVELVHNRFTQWELDYPHFTFAQIKSKFGTSRVYCDGVPVKELLELEESIINYYDFKRKIS